MSPYRRPPLDILPEQFFMRWLPIELERLGSVACATEMIVRVQLDGDGGGSWDLVARGGTLDVSPSASQLRPQVKLRLSVQDWRAIMVGESGPVDLTPPSASPTDLLFVDSASQQLLSAISGTFRFEVHDYNDRTWTLWATFGDRDPVEPPTAVISTDASTYGAILARNLSAPEAYLSKKITVTGDASLGIQVGLALLPKF